ncbi:pyridoxal phosphate-dependent transferase [Phyllosticta citrichinensis]|uniref:Pyridoxal phosphate-dependent transferase n=1 Tax=Phyllosticta citrichinensis TaxID=1130410 RepID=A0ABR1XSK8_9PEZI
MAPLTPLEEHFVSLLARRKTRSLLRRIEDAPPPSVADFTSNDYLSLSSHPEITQTYLSYLTSAFAQPQTQSPSPLTLGSTGSRLLSGHHPLAAHLETLIPAHHNAPAGLLFTSGYDANAALLSTLPQPGDAVLYDALVHASAHDGMRLSRVAATNGLRRFAHNDPAALAAALRRLVDEHAAFAAGSRNVFVVVEAVYSMDGDVAALRQMLDVVDAALPAGNGYVVVDEAHATGVVGRGGRGLVCAEGLESRVFARVVTFGKAVGAAGAIVLCTPPTKQYLINYARPFIYTTAPSFPSLAAIKVVYDFLLARRADPLVAHLRHLHATLSSSLAALVAALAPPSRLLSLSLLESPPFQSPHVTPIVPIFTQHPRALAAFVRTRGFAVRPIVAPTVPRGTERVRVCLHAGNSVEEVEGLVRAVGEWVKERLKREGEKKEGERARL